MPSYRRRLTLVSAALLAVAALLYLWTRPNHRGQTLDDRSEAAYLLAAHLAEHQPGARVLVIGNPFTRLAESPGHVRAYETSVVRGLREGFKNQVELIAVAYPELKPGATENPHRFGMPADATTPLSYLVTDESFARLAGDYDADILLSLVGIPIDLVRQPWWADPQAPALACYLPDLWMLGRPADIAQAFGSGRLLAAVVPVPNPPDGAPAYQVLTAETVRDHPLVQY